MAEPKWLDPTQQSIEKSNLSWAQIAALETKSANLKITDLRNISFQAVNNNAGSNRSQIHSSGGVANNQQATNNPDTIANQNPNLRSRPEVRGSQAIFKCSGCKRKGHSQEECWFLYLHLRPRQRREGDSRGGHQKRSKAFVASSSGENKQGGIKFDLDSNAPSLNLSENDLIVQLINNLSKLLNQEQNNKSTGIVSLLSKNLYTNNNIWILDSGATDHMTGNGNLLTKIKELEKPQYVTIANGSKVPISGIGNINFLHHEISDVLYLPDFTTNLISVSKLTKDLNCNIMFSSKNVVLQDKITGKQIGEGSFENGLYYLDFPNKSFAARNIDVENKLLHFRVGHPSDKVFSRIFPSNRINSSNCDICRFSKQKRLPFLLSESKTTKIFELVHFDVWGPAPIDSFNNFKYYVTSIDDFSSPLGYIY